MTPRDILLPKPTKPTKRIKEPKKLKRGGKKIPRRKKTPLARAQDRAWALFTAYVKERDGNVCWSCGAGNLEGSNCHGGHLFNSGNHSALRYHPDNVHPQCGRCNVWLSGNAAPYAAAVIDRLGIEKFQLLNAHAQDGHKWTKVELDQMAEKLLKGGAEFELWYESNYGLASEANSPNLDTEA